MIYKIKIYINTISTSAVSFIIIYYYLLSFIIIYFIHFIPSIKFKFNDIIIITIIKKKLNTLLIKL